MGDSRMKMKSFSVDEDSVCWLKNLSVATGMNESLIVRSLVKQLVTRTGVADAVDADGIPGLRGEPAWEAERKKRSVEAFRAAYNYLVAPDYEQMRKDRVELDTLVDSIHNELNDIINGK